MTSPSSPPTLPTKAAPSIPSLTVNASSSSHERNDDFDKRNANNILLNNINVIFCTIILCIYIHTSYPYVSGGDTGELVITTCNVGVAHPPGYPLYTMLGIMFKHLLPFGPVAWRVSMLTCVLSSTSVYFIYKSIWLLTNRSIIASILGSGCYALSPLVWLYAVQGEVFGLNNLLCSIMIYLTIKYFQTSSIQYAYIGAFVCGLAATNQHTTIFYIIPIVISVLIHMIHYDLFHSKHLLYLCVCLLVGLSPYLYLPYSASLKSSDSWGDQRTLGGFLHHFLRREYGTFQLASEVGAGNNPGVWVRLSYYFYALLKESLYVGPFLCIIGIFVSLKASYSRVPSAVLLCCFILYVGVFHYLANLDPTRPLFYEVQARFWQQPNILVFIWIGIAYDFLWRDIIYKYVWSSLSFTPIPLVCTIIIVVIQGNMHYKSRDNSDTKCFQAAGEAVLNSLPPNSIVLVNGDLNNNIIKYPNQCENFRTDIHVISPQLMSWDWFVDMQAHNYKGVVFPGHKYHPRVPKAFSMKQFLDINYHRFPIFLCGGWKDGDDTHMGVYDEIPFGHCQWIIKQGVRPGNWIDMLERGWKSLPTMSQLGPWKVSKYTPGTWEAIVYQDLWKRTVYLASYISFHSNQNMNSEKLASLARKAMDRIFSPRMKRLLDAYDLLSVSMYRDAGVVFGQWSKRVHDKKQEKMALKYEKKMLNMWTQYVIKASNGTCVCVLSIYTYIHIYIIEESKQIQSLVTGRVNPYINRKIL